MKVNLKDVTFIIAVRIDSIERLENIQVITEQLCKLFQTNILVVEAGYFCNGILKKILNKAINYLFIEDKDPVFFRAKYFNQSVLECTTPIVAMWDADVVIDKDAIIDAVKKLRDNEADVSYPYNGKFYETSFIIRRMYLKNRSIALLHKHKNKLDLLYHQLMVGGAFIIKKDKYIDAGIENENHYGWGNDDFDRYYRFVNKKYRFYFTSNCLFHLCHPRTLNSYYRSSIHEKRSSDELIKIKHSSEKEIQNLFSNNKRP